MAALVANDVRVAEIAHNFTNRVSFADIGQELVAQPLTLARSLHESRDVDELDRRRDDTSRMRDFGKLVETLVGYRNDADVGIDGRERIVGGKTGLIGQGRE